MKTRTILTMLLVVVSMLLFGFACDSNKTTQVDLGMITDEFIHRY